MGEESLDALTGAKIHSNMPLHEQRAGESAEILSTKQVDIAASLLGGISSLSLSRCEDACSVTAKCQGDYVESQTGFKSDQKK